MRAKISRARTLFVHALPIPDAGNRLAFAVLTMIVFGTLSSAQCSKSGRSNPTPTSRYVLHDDEALDKQTGLTWKRCAVGQKWEQSTCKESPKVSLEETPVPAPWRVPSKEELATLVSSQPSSAGVCINAAVFPGLGSGDTLFSSDKSEVLDFADGMYFKRGGRWRGGYRWVRGTGKIAEQTVPEKILADSDFILSKNRLTVRDSKTGLIWMRCFVGDAYDPATDDCKTSVYLVSHSEAERWANGGWRLPTFDEVQTLRENVRSASGHGGVAFPGSSSRAEYYAALLQEIYAHSYKFWLRESLSEANKRILEKRIFEDLDEYETMHFDGGIWLATTTVLLTYDQDEKIERLQPVHAYGEAGVLLVRGPEQASKSNAAVSSPHAKSPAASLPSSQPQPASESSDTWTDPATRLTWTKHDSGDNQNLTWQQAIDTCQNLRLKGRADWRLPTIDELAGIYDPKMSENFDCCSKDGGYRGFVHVKGNLQLTGWEWSSSPGNAAGQAWSMGFFDGDRFSYQFEFSTARRCLCVLDTRQ